MWWQPRGWAALRTWVSEKVGEDVSWTLTLEDPLAERIALGVTAMENMSVR
jgi:hypothetical protein